MDMPRHKPDCKHNKNSSQHWKHNNEQFNSNSPRGEGHIVESQFILGSVNSNDQNQKRLKIC